MIIEFLAKMDNSIDFFGGCSLLILLFLILIRDIFNFHYSKKKIVIFLLKMDNSFN